MSEGKAEVSHRVEEGLLFRLKQKAYDECRSVADAYAACMSGRTLTAAWACRPEMFELSDCLSKHTSRLDELKARYIAAGQPTHPDWDALLDGL